MRHAWRRREEGLRRHELLQPRRLALGPGRRLHRPDLDFDGTSYQPDWSGTLTDPVQDRRLHAESFLFTSPLTGGRNYDRMAFEADLPAIEPLSVCDLQGNGCVNPPPGAQFYPLYSTRTGNGACAWQEGGPYIPGTSNTFGGSSTTEYGTAP